MPCLPQRPPPLAYSTTNREGYREYRSRSYHCIPGLNQARRARNATEVMTRHLWQDYMDMAEAFRLTLGMRDVYRKRKEIIERVFADMKEEHGMRYTHYRGRARLKFEIGMTYACMNLKMMANRVASSLFFHVFRVLFAWIFPDYTTKAVQPSA